MLLRWSRELVSVKRKGAIWIMGRPRKIGKRERNGRVSRAIADPEEWTRDLDRWMNDPTAIYVTEAGALTKIGITKNPKQRTKGLQTANGQIVRMAWYRWMHGPDARKLEKAIHDKFRGSKYHAHGEWYYLDADTAIGIVSKMTHEMGLFAVWEKWSAYVERHWDDPTRDNLPNPFNVGVA